MIYAFSRDGGLPGSKYWHKINPKTRTPTNAVWLGVVTSASSAACRSIQKDGYSMAFFALTGICVVGLYISYVIPVVPAAAQPELPAGPVEPQGLAARSSAGSSLAWVALISILFVSPLFWPFGVGGRATR